MLYYVQVAEMVTPHNTGRCSRISRDGPGQSDAHPRISIPASGGRHRDDFQSSWPQHRLPPALSILAEHAGGAEGCKGTLLHIHGGGWVEASDPIARPS